MGHCHPLECAIFTCPWYLKIPKPLANIVLPNLPFFYAAYRLWSHHKGTYPWSFSCLPSALKGAEYLEELLNQNELRSESSPILDKIYALEKPPTLTREDIPLGQGSEELLLNKAQLSDLAKEFQDNEILVLGKRAITQITKKLEGEIAKREERGRQQHEGDIAASEKETVKAKESKEPRK